MAIFHPESLFGDEPSSEIRVRRALQVLSDDWHVFHRVRWQSVRGGRQGDGEADFILLHPAHGIVVAEVKGGRIDLVDGRWYTTDRHDHRHPIKDPFQQAVDSKHALLTFLAALLPAGRVPRICHLVIFPDEHIDEEIGLNPRAITWGYDELAAVGGPLDRLLAHWTQLHSSSMSGAEIESIVRRLAPTIKVRNALRSDVAASEQQVLSLTERQVALLAHLRRVRRCITNGPAGTGKTILAVEKARQLAADGARVLFVCFNAPLAEHLRGLLPTNVGVATFHAHVVSLGRRVGITLPVNDVEALSAKLEELSIALAARQTEKFDAVIVDEGQDFAASWLALLDTSLLVPNGFLYVFADPHQQLYAHGYAEPPNCFPFELSQNCRNTLPIARVAARSLGDVLPETGPAGAEVSFIDPAGDELGLVQSVVDDLVVREHVPPKEIVVLCRSRASVDSLRQRVTSTSSFVDSQAKTGIFVETIHRFKGLEAPVVVLVPGAAADETARALLYVGASRARSFLVVVAGVAVCRLLQEPAR